MTLSVIGAGFGRTGTSSLKLALEQLGFGPVCHSSDPRHFRQGTDFWQQVLDRKPIDWDEYFDGYRATVDSPSCKFYGELAQKYPTAKVILTWRDPNRWFDSYEATVLPMITSSQGGKHFSFLFGECSPERACLISAYERHNAEVQRSIPADRLLVYEVERGWQLLCEFLGVPIPDTPFPSLNLRMDFPAVIDEMLRRL